MSCARCSTSSHVTFQCQKCPQRFCAPCAHVSGCLRSCAHCNTLLCSACESMDQCRRCGFFACSACRSNRSNQTNILLCDQCPKPLCAECKKPPREKWAGCSSCDKIVCFDCFNDKGLLISCSGMWGFDYGGPTILEPCENPEMFCVDCAYEHLSSKGFPVFQEFDSVMAEVGYPYMKSLMCGSCYSKAVDDMAGQCCRCKNYIPHCPEDEIGFTCGFCNNAYCGCCMFCKKTSCNCHKLVGCEESFLMMRFHGNLCNRISLDQWEESEAHQCDMCQMSEMESLHVANQQIKAFPDSVLGLIKDFAFHSFFKKWDERTFGRIMKKKSNENQIEI